MQHDHDLGEAQRRNFSKAVKAGVKLTFGTDTGICPYGTAARQFAFMVKYGMTPMQAIQAATVNAADIIAVHGDPLADIRTLEHVSFVMKEGKIFKREP